MAVHRFASPYYLLLLIPLAAAAWYVYRRRVTRALLFSPFSRIPAAHATWRTLIRPLLPALVLAGVGLAIVALARPQTVFSRTTRHTDAIAIEMVVDAAGAMAALDFATQVDQRSRLDVVKDTFGKFVQMRPNDLVGLVTFGGFASSRVPLTIDHEALLHSLSGVAIPNGLDANGNPVNQEEMMTAIGDALATACARLQGAEVKSRIAVLLTDGESNTGIIKPEDAIKAAKTLGIRVYTIGVGSNTRAPFMVRDMFGRNVIQYAEVRLDEDLLRKIASGTGGQYFNVTDPKGLNRAMEAINKLEKTRIDAEQFNQYDEHFLLFLVPGLGLILLGAGLNSLLAKAVA